MKIGIVGAGLVGATAGYAIVLQDLVSDLVFVDKDKARAEGEAMDISHATPFTHPTRVRAGGYEDLAGAALVIVTAGASQKPGDNRLDLGQKNAAVFDEVIPQIVAHAADTVLLVATNPVDVMTQLAWQGSGLPKARVIGSGTALDTARLRALVGARAEVSPHNVHGYVLGEHGDSAMVPWRSMDIAGLSLRDYFAGRKMRWDEDLEAEILDNVRRAAYTIIERKGSTYYGVGMVLARISEAVLRDERAVLTVSASDGEVAYSLPRVLGGSGIVTTIEVELSSSERLALDKSVAVVKEAVAHTQNQTQEP